MKNLTALNSALLFGALLAASGVANAQSETLVSARISPMIGSYSGEAKGTLLEVEGEPCTGECQFKVEFDPELAFGAAAGLRVSNGDWYADFSASSLRVDQDSEEFFRSELIAQIGYALNDMWSIFGGYRSGLGGDQVFDDSVFTERGLFLGVGFGGLETGAVSWSGSAAYNLSKSEFQDASLNGDDIKLDYPGFSVALAARLKSHPQHAIQARLQVFSGDKTLEDSVPTENGSVSFKYKQKQEETYVMVSYVFSFVLN